MNTSNAVKVEMEIMDLERSRVNIAKINLPVWTEDHVGKTQYCLPIKKIN